MNFTQLVLQETDEKYQNMLHGDTPEPIDGDVFPDECGEYDRKRKNYLARLEKEKTKFNSAIKSVNKTRDARLEEESSVKNKEKADAEALLPIRIVFFVFAAVMLLLTFVPIRLGVSSLVERHVFNAIGFPVFFDDDKAPVPLILSIVLGIIGAIIYFIYIIKSEADEGACLGKLIFTGAVGGLVFLAVRLVIALLAYIIYVLFTPFILPALGLTSLIIIGVKGRELQLQPSKSHRIAMTVFTLLITGACGYFGFTYFF